MTTCPACKTSFDAASAAGGQCPRCLLMGGAADVDGSPQSMGGSWTPPSVEVLQPLLPAYELLAFIGRGGMGAVYKARQPALDRLVAIKLLPAATLETDDAFGERFKNEARMLARMSHPGIVHVYDFSVLADGSCCFVMEYVDGTDVARMVAGNGKLSPEHAASITADVCAALHYAHEAGIVHRDIKPANILVNRHGQVKVADFGLAKAQDPSLQSHTQTRVTMGTPEFLAPESLTAGMMVDHRADLYAVGVMLYNMLTGQIPRGIFPPASVTAPAPRAFDDIIAKAMQADPEQRYQTAAAIRSDLEQTRTCPVPAPQRPNRWRRPAVLASAACVAAAAGLWQLSGNNPLPDPVPAAQPVVAETPQPKAPPDSEAEQDMPDLEAFFRTLQEANPDSGLLNRASRDKDGGARVHWNAAVRFLNLSGLPTIKNIDCLQPMRFTHLDLRGTGVRDLRPVLTGALQSLYFTNAPGLDTSGLRSQQLHEVLVEGPHPFPLEHVVSPSLCYLDLKDVPVESLALLSGCPGLRNLFLAGCPVQDLSPLQGVALQTLSLQTTRVSSLEPLRGMKLLHEVKIFDCPVSDFSPLRDLPGLQTLSVNGADYEGTSLRKFLDKSQAPAESPGSGDTRDVPSILEKLARLNPGCGPLTADSKTPAGEALVSLSTENGDLWLRLRNQPALRDISPLEGSGFTHLDLRDTSVSDLSPLRSTSLRMLQFTTSAEMDTSPLRGIETLAEVVIQGSHPVRLEHIVTPALYYLDLSGAAPTSLEPLKACKALRILFLTDNQTVDISPLRDLPLESLTLLNTKPASLEHIRSQQLKSVCVSGVSPEALAPLLSLPKLQKIYCDQGEFTPASLAEMLAKQRPPR